jgi:DNA polymerase-3 subunit gamma/tau
MSYLILARKYRPQKFEDIIGQEHIWRVLKNAIKENRLAHGYIFSGQRGIGKTTTARIFAKALNCAGRKNEEPCDTCNSCVEITRGSSLDVIEIDGASNRGIDEIRNLRENIKYAPSAAKYKIYIIDEAHQITVDAFNALLKTLEEPPAHAIFIFATTSPQKIPATIQSRCQRFNFRPVPVKDISGHILSLAKKENIKIDEPAAALIARSAGGSLRDALSVFDQVISFCGEKIDADTVVTMLGMVREDVLAGMMKCILENDSAQLLRVVDDTVAAGYDPLGVATDLQEYIRNILLHKISPDTAGGLADTEKLEYFSKNISADVLLRYIDMLSACLSQMRYAEQPVLVLEIFCVKLTRKYVGLDELVSRIEALESSEPGSYGDDTDDIPAGPESENRQDIKSPAANSGDDTGRTAGTTAAIPSDTKQKRASQAKAGKPAIETGSGIADIEAGGAATAKIKKIWAELVSDRKISPMLATCLIGSRIAGVNNGGAVVEFPNTTNMELVTSRKAEWLPLIEEKLGAKFDFTAQIASRANAAVNSDEEQVESEQNGEEDIVAEIEEQRAKDGEKGSAAEKSKTPAGEILEKEPMAQTIIDLFGGKIEELK